MDKLAEKVIGYLEGTEIFFKQQTPDFVNQFITYQTWMVYWLLALWGTLFIITVVIQIVNLITWIIAKHTDDLEGRAFITCVIGIVGFFLFLATLDTYLEYKQLELAPKVYMVRQAKRIFK